MRNAAKQKPSAAGPIASAVAASAGALPEKIRPEIRPLDLDTVCTLVGQPAWDKIGLHTRLAFAILQSETKGVDIAKTVADLLDTGDNPPYEDTLVKMSQARVALLEIAAMMKVSLRKQWKAVDAYLVANGSSPTQAEDELCDDEDLLALRPLIEAGHLNAVTDAAAHQGLDIVTRVAVIRAHTKEGIQFKREVQHRLADRERPELDASIFADLLAYVEASP